MICPFDGTEIVPGFTTCKSCGAMYIKRMGSGWQFLVVAAMFFIVFAPMIIAWIAGSFLPLVAIPIGGGFLVWFANNKLAQYQWVRRL